MDITNNNNNKDYTYYKQYYFKVNKLVFQSFEDMQKFININNSQQSNNEILKENEKLHNQDSNDEGGCKKKKIKKSKIIISNLGCKYKHLPKVLKIQRGELESLYNTIIFYRNNNNNQSSGCHNTFVGFGGIFKKKEGLQLYIKSTIGDIKIDEIIWSIDKDRSLIIGSLSLKNKNNLKHTCGNYICQNPDHIVLNNK